MPIPSDQPTPDTPDLARPTDAERRAALAKLGKLAALTPPTIMTLLLSARASAISPPPDDPTNG